jgi:hypothetical protein
VSPTGRRRSMALECGCDRAANASPGRELPLTGGAGRMYGASSTISHSSVEFLRSPRLEGSALGCGPYGPANDRMDRHPLQRFTFVAEAVTEVEQILRLVALVILIFPPVVIEVFQIK